MGDNQEILLQSGTGEMEILEFSVGGKKYAINVVKVKEILEIENITKLPNANPAIAGVSLVRGDVITVVDLRYVLDNANASINKKNMTIICEFNQMKVAFFVDQVLGIHRIGWDDIKKPDSLTENSLVIGNITVNEKIIMFLDFEKIVTDISPSSGINEEGIKNIEYKDRSNTKLVLVDDSPTIRSLLKNVLTKAGYKNLIFYNDGQQVLDFLEELVKQKGDSFKNDVQLLITDIEMPNLDGHTLTRKIKENETLSKLPVIIFSSLITKELLHKGESVGADAQLSKPDVGNLVQLIDEMIL